MGVAQRRLLRLTLFTDRHTVLTPVCKRTMVQGQQKIRRRSAQCIQFLLRLTPKPWHRTKQRPGIGMPAFIEDLLRRPSLYHLACVHHLDAVRKIRHYPQVMGHKDDRRVHLRLQLHHQVHDLRLDGHIQRRSRLVRNQYVGITCKRNGNHHPLAHTPGHLMGIVVNPLLRTWDIYHLQHVNGFLPRRILVELLMDHQALHDLFPNGHGRV